MEYAIDFGTSNTVVARRQGDGTCETVRLPGLSAPVGPPVIPSLVWVGDRPVVGQAVLDRGLAEHPHCFAAFKRGIGVPGPGFYPEINGRVWDGEALGAAFLGEILAALPEVTALTLTVPVGCFEAYRRWLQQVVAAVPQVRLVDEPLAAVLGYDRTVETVLMVDCGGGTLDLALVQLPPLSAATKAGFWVKWGDRFRPQSPRKPAVARAIAKAGENLGGADLDRWLAEFLGLPTHRGALRLCERLKIALSTQERAVETWWDEETLTAREIAVTRQQLADLWHARGFETVLDRALAKVQRQAATQGFDWASLGAVVLVGGLAQLPMLPQWAARHFPKVEIQSSQPLEAIARGALNRELALADVLYHSYGVRYWDKREKAHNWQPIVQAGTPYPLTEPVVLTLGASQPDQPYIELLVGELGETETEWLWLGDRLVANPLASRRRTALPLNAHQPNLAPLHPPGQPGQDRLRVEFTVNAERTLCLTVIDLLTNTVLLDRQPAIALL
ncbi:MAG: Hsp70 family protein [Pseudanabaenaceae cyanobacterium]